MESQPPLHGQTVAVVITTYNDAQFLHEALTSVIRQRKVPNEIFVIDDGSDVSPAAIVESFSGATLIRKANGGLASARNAGLKAATSQYIAFLDADDRFRSDGIATGLDCFAHAPHAAMVYGGHTLIRADGSPLGVSVYQAASHDPYADLLAINMIGMHAAVLYRRDILVAAGGFDEGLRRCEDYDLYLRLTREYPIASHPNVVADYRFHGHNMSSDTASMLSAVLAVHDRHREQTGARQEAWLAGRKAWKSWYKTGQRKSWRREPETAPSRLSGLARMIGKRAKSLLRMRGMRARLRAQFASVTWGRPRR